MIIVPRVEKDFAPSRFPPKTACLVQVACVILFVLPDDSSQLVNLSTPVPVPPSYRVQTEIGCTGRSAVGTPVHVHSCPASDSGRLDIHINDWP